MARNQGPSLGKHARKPLQLLTIESLLYSEQTQVVVFLFL